MRKERNGEELQTTTNVDGFKTGKPRGDSERKISAAKKSEHLKLRTNKQQEARTKALMQATSSMTTVSQVFRGVESLSDMWSRKGKPKQRRSHNDHRERGRCIGLSRAERRPRGKSLDYRKTSTWVTAIGSFCVGNTSMGCLFTRGSKP